MKQKIKNNFLSYEVPSSLLKKEELKKSLSNLLESLSVEELNKLYQKKEVLPKTTSQVVLNTPVTVNKVNPVSDTLATVNQLPGEDKLVIGIKKPLKVVFKDESHSNNDSLVDTVTESTTYDFLSAAPPLDLSSDLETSFKKIRNNSSENMSEQVSHNDIKSIEEDLDGFSVVGLDNGLGMDLL